MSNDNTISQILLAVLLIMIVILAVLVIVYLVLRMKTKIQPKKDENEEGKIKGIKEKKIKQKHRQL